MNKPLLEVINKKKIDRVPIWVMRQAGRYLPEFMEIRRENKDFIKLCLTPNLVKEITLQPLKRFDLDAAILFSDILIVPLLMGHNVTFSDKGPEVGQYNMAYVEQEYGDVLGKINEAIKQIKSEIENNYPNTAFIGFAGSPWTIACYMMEGKLSRDCHVIKSMMYSDTKSLEKLIDRIIERTIEYLKMQIDAGVEVVKLFDSWAGVLTEEYFYRFVIKPTKTIVDSIRAYNGEIKIIGFPRGAGFLYQDYVDNTKVDVVALDQYVPLKWAKKHLSGAVLQGNMDNILLAASKRGAIRAAEEIIEIMSDQGFIFNLGHGIIPTTPPENLEVVVNAIRNR
ncbi:MAG: uroporphyrinogen decarboxylase [Proteobacteria bacterium]|nr:uroporphyrinogen decarboxylase [Pseudomonadota bacterium]